jgi:hypothetical protein
MVQAADLWKLNDLARRGELDAPEVGCVLVEREVRARLMVIGKVVGQDSAQVSFAEHENVVQALAPDRTDQVRRERILPRAVRCRQINYLAADGVSTTDREESPVTTRTGRGRCHRLLTSGRFGTC